jgi:hypothetical protein
MSKKRQTNKKMMNKMSIKGQLGHKVPPLAVQGPRKDSPGSGLGFRVYGLGFRV